MPRVFIFGLDAGSLPLIERWQDSLPNFSRLMQQGSYGLLHSTIPPFTSPAWACMSTGKNPAKAGIFGLRHRQKDTYQFISPTSANRHAPAIWDIVTQHGRTAIVMNVPDTYPPTPLQGLMISGRPAPVDPGAPITYPDDLRRQLNQRTGGYEVGSAVDFDEASRSHELTVWQKVLAKQQDVIEHLMNTQEWDLFFYVSMAIDGISHHFWQHLDPKHPQHNPDISPQYRDTIQQIYQYEDERLGRIMDTLQEDDFLFVVSDHGSTPCYHHISVNRWLIENGFLVLSKEDTVYQNNMAGTMAQWAFSWYGRSSLVRKMTRPFRQTGLRDAVVFAHFAQKSAGRIPLGALSIDWQKTTAYYLGDDRLYLNVAGREPQGIVQPGTEYEQVRTRLREALLATRVPETEQPLFTAVYTREELYDGPYLADAPDLILVPGNVHWSLGGAVGSQVFEQPVTAGKHHPEGVFIAWGKEIQNSQRSQASIYDIAPTVLHALGLPVPEDSDGRVQTAWFKPGSTAATNPVTTESVPERQHEEYVWQANEANQIEARLRDLGYMD